MIKHTTSANLDAGARSSTLKKWLTIFLAVVAISGTVFSMYYFSKYQSLKANPNLEAEKELERLVEAVSKFMELPDDEIPTVATVLNKEELKDQRFFAKAENGDKILAYSNAKQAILYRPSVGKIINVASIFIDQKEEDGSQRDSASMVSTGLKIAYYNGTETVGLSLQAKKVIDTEYPNYQTGALTNAFRRDYTETLVVDLRGKYNKEAVQIAGLLGGRVSAFPEEEVKPDADILIISGEGSSNF